MEKIISKLERYFGNFQFAVFDEQKKQRWIVEASRKSISYLKAMNAQGRHIFVKPVDESCFMLCDDLAQAALERYHTDTADDFRPGRMVIETSPENYQVWIRAGKPVTFESKRYWLGKMGSDPGCVPRNRWGRSPGFRNRKEKYRRGDGYPLAKLIWVDWQTLASVPNVEPDLFPSSPPPSKPRHSANKSVWLRDAKRKTSGGECAFNFSPVDRSRYECGDESATDFKYCLALMRRGFDDNAIRDRLISERTNWQNHKGGNRLESYLKRTIQNARRLIT